MGLCLLRVARLVEAIFDPLNPGDEENFDPAEADPEGNITCPDDGDLRYLRLPIIEGRLGQPHFDPATFTLQQLCAKPQYGGRGPYQHLGGFCVGDTRDWGRTVAFDHSPRARSSLALASTRLALYCQTRCYCNNPDATPSNRLGNLITRTNSPYPPFSHSTYRLDKAQFLLGEESHELGRRLIRVKGRDQLNMQKERVRILTGQLPLPGPDEPEYGLNYRWPRTHAIYLHSSNDIQCFGDLPEWPLPIPAGWESLMAEQGTLTLQKLCSASLLRGNRLHFLFLWFNCGDAENPSSYFNAGGYCHQDQSSRRKDVFFSDEMTPHPTLRWDNFLVSVPRFEEL